MSEVITISCKSLSASIDTAGAQLMSLKKEGGEYLWQRDPQWWPRCAPVLFPIVGNIRDDRADSAQGEIRFGRHGLARNYDFEVTGGCYSLETWTALGAVCDALDSMLTKL
jgi:galactose mutarotase-like enzyme